MRPLRSGHLRHELTIETLSNPSTTLDSRGQPTRTWNRLATVRAMVEPLRGQEALLARQLYATASHKLTFRYQPNVTTQARATHRGRVFNFHDVRNVEERDRVLEVICTEQL